MNKAQRRKPLKSGQFLQDAESKKKKLCRKWFRNECPREESKCRYYHGSFPCKFYHLSGNCKFEDRCRYSHGGTLSLHFKSVLVDHVLTDPDDFVRPFKRRAREKLWAMLDKSEEFHDQSNNNEEEEPAFDRDEFNNGRGDLDGTIFFVTNQFASYNVPHGTKSVLMDTTSITHGGPLIQQHYDDQSTYNNLDERSWAGTSRPQRISSSDKNGRHLMNEEIREKTELCRKWAHPRRSCIRNESECWYYHGSFPCKFYHLGKSCRFKDGCRFTHGGPLTQHLKEALANHLANDPDDVIGGFPKYTVEESLERMEKNEKKLREKLKFEVRNFQTKPERRTTGIKRKEKSQSAGNAPKKCKNFHVDSNCTTNSGGTNRSYCKDESRVNQKQTSSTDPKTTQNIENKLENVSFEIRTTSETSKPTIITVECKESSSHTEDFNEISNHTKDTNETFSHSKDFSETSNHTKDSNESSVHEKDSNESPTSTLSTSVLNEISKWMLSDSRFDGPSCSKISKVIDDNRNTNGVVHQSGNATTGETVGGRDTEFSYDTPVIESPPKIQSPDCWYFTRRSGISHFIKQSTGEKEKLIPVSSYEQSEGSLSELSQSSSLDRSCSDTIQTNKASAPEDDFYTLFTRRRKAKSPDEPVLSKVRKMELEIMRIPTESTVENASVKIDGFSCVPPNEAYRDVDLRPYLPHPKAIEGEKCSSYPAQKNDLTPVVTGEKSQLPRTWKLKKIQGNFGPAYGDSCLKVSFDEALNDPRFKKHLHRFF